MELLKRHILHRKEETLKNRYGDFPNGLTFAQFEKMDPAVRKKILATNPILRTDTYNRTMEHLAGSKWDTPATYVLQMRSSPHGYLITAGVEDIVRDIADTKITQSMLNFATDYYRNTKGVSFFDPRMWQEVIDKYHGKLPFTIDCLPDGTAILPGDPVLRVSGPNELVAHFEPEFHRAFYPTLVATHAHTIAQHIGADRFIEVGLRGALSDTDHLTAVKAMYIGGGITKTSNDLAAGYYPEFSTVGTIGHRKVQEFAREKDAFRDAVKKLDTVTLLVDLNDAYHGIDMALELKKEFRSQPKTIWMRLDSGDVGAQTLYALREQKKLGFLDPKRDKIVVEGIETIEDMTRIDAMVRSAGFDPKQFVVYGAGGLLVAYQTSRSDASTAFKLTSYDGKPTMKFSNSPGKESIPGQPTLAATGKRRIIAQVGEYPSSADLFVRAYDNGKVYLSDNLKGAHEHAETSFRGLQQTSGTKSEKSPKTRQLTEQITSERSRRISL